MNENIGLLREAWPTTMFQRYLMEAATSVENELANEDKGWINLSTTATMGLSDATRIGAVQTSRRYYYTDPMAAQAIRLWTDYTFGTGMTWSVEEENKEIKKVLESFWNSKDNKSVLSARGQRKSSDKLLVDGEIFFAIFLGPEGQNRIRRIDPLEITDIITNPDDIEDVMYYKREWVDQQGKGLSAYFRSAGNIKGKPYKDYAGKTISGTEGPIVYHITHRTIGQRGTPLSMPAHFYLKYNQKFLASRISIALALSRFAWKTKVKGGQAAIDAVKAKTNDKEIAAGSHLLENLGSDTTPIRTESGASAAYQDGRMIKLMIASAYGIPEQYFGDISIGNLATAKTVELPMMKMFQSYQAIWAGAYKDINDIVLEHNGVPEDKWYVDLDFPAIAPEDIAQAAVAIVGILGVMPELAESDDVKQVALMTMGINDPAEVIAQLTQEAKRNPGRSLARDLKWFRESLSKREH